MAEAKAFKMIPHCTKDTISYEMDELIRCKDCKHYDPTVHFCNNLETHNIYEDFACIEGEPFPELHFCPDAERRTDE